MTRTELVSSQSYWLVKIQLDLSEQLETYLQENDMSRTQLAEKLGVTKGYVSQVLNGDFDHKISKLVELSLAIGLVPTIRYEPLEAALEADKKAIAQSEPKPAMAHA